MSGDLIDRAVAEWREAHPEDDDLPVELLASLTYVQCRALGIGFSDLFAELRRSYVDALAMIRGTAGGPDQ